MLVIIEKTLDHFLVNVNFNVEIIVESLSKIIEILQNIDHPIKKNNHHIISIINQTKTMCYREESYMNILENLDKIKDLVIQTII